MTFMPPWLMHLAFKNPEGRGFGLWFPLFILWPLALLVVLPIMVLWLAAAVVLVWARQGRYILSVPWLIYGVICAMRGLVVQVREDRQNIDILFL